MKTWLFGFCGFYDVFGFFLVLLMKVGEIQHEKCFIYRWFVRKTRLLKVTAVGKTWLPCCSVRKEIGKCDITKKSFSGH